MGLISLKYERYEQSRHRGITTDFCTNAESCKIFSRMFLYDENGKHYKLNPDKTGIYFRGGTTSNSALDLYRSNSIFLCDVENSIETANSVAGSSTEMYQPPVLPSEDSTRHFQNFKCPTGFEDRKEDLKSTHLGLGSVKLKVI